jgi:ketosteroid isomerase-like protein
MTATIQELWTIYADAWRDVSPEERQRLLDACLADDVTFTSPDNNDQGIANFIPVLEKFQKTFPGAYFETTDLIVQNNQSLAAWAMTDRAGTVLLNGHSYARYGEQGRIVHLAGFWQA